MSSDGKTLFGRIYNVTIGTLDVSALRCSFRVKKSLKPEPNVATVKIWNLSEKSRAVFSGKGALKIRVEAGYRETGLHQIYLGEVRSGHSTVEGPDIVTEVTTGDGETAIQTSRIHVPVGPSMPVNVVLEAIVKALGVGQGNVGQLAAALSSSGVASMFGPGSALSGSAARQLTDFCRSADLEWSIQDGKIQILNLNKPLEGKAVKLSPSSGLLGSPTVDGKGVVKAKTLMIPELAPGRLVVFESKGVNGGYRLQQVEYVGDTHGEDWGTEIECKKY